MKKQINFIESNDPVIDNAIVTKYINCTKHAALDFLNYHGIEQKLQYIISPLEFHYECEQEMNMEHLFDTSNINETNGIRIIREFFSDYKELFAHCKNAIMNESPLLMWTEWYFVKDTRFYKKMRRDPHNTLIVGFDDEDEKICISDRWLEAAGTFEDTTRWVSSTVLQEAIESTQGNSFIQSFQLKEKTVLKNGEELKKEMLEKSIHNMTGSGMGIEKMLCFAKDLKTGFLKDEAGIKPYAKTIGSQLFRDYVGSRYLWSVYVAQLNEDEQIQEGLMNQAIAWWKIIAVLWSKQPSIYETACMIQVFAENEKRLLSLVSERYC
ncbi:MAG TPA: hypothetical protein DCW90_23190 [Lachnospiraceae bacterium]|nr:hypothetical protein [uncultured Lachnoclostridium sp.]HAU88272.1 hypothetical protein [Lachnospiraceae bacterium]